MDRRRVTPLITAVETVVCDRRDLLNGVRQVTHKGWPLYTYVNDRTRGVISGNAVSNFYVAKLTLKAAHSTTSGSSW